MIFDCVKKAKIFVEPLCENILVRKVWREILMKNNATIKNVLIISLIVILILGIIIVFHVIRYQFYDSVEAAVIETYVDTGLGQGGDESSVKYVIIEYSHNGVDYTYKKELGMFENFSNGDKVWIRCNPKDYSDVENQRSFRALWLVEGVLILWSGLLLFATIRQKTSS